MSTVAVGNQLRDRVGELMSAAGFAVQYEVNIGSKNVDILCTDMDQIRGKIIAIECKNHSGTLSGDQVRDFIYNYHQLVRDGHVSAAFLITKEDITPNGKMAFDGKSGIRHFTFRNFFNVLLDSTQYMSAIEQEYHRDGIDEYYIDPYSTGGILLNNIVQEWLADTTQSPLVILGSYGTGKTTFARWLTSKCIDLHRNDQTRRIPIYIPLGDILDENSIEGLLGKMFTYKYRIQNYSFSLFDKLNRAGAFLIIFDGLDEMKHGMTYTSFINQCRILFRLHGENAKILLLGRPNAISSDRQFKLILKGKRLTPNGTEVPIPEIPPCHESSIADFSEESALLFVNKYFQRCGRKAQLPEDAINARLSHLTSGRFKNIIQRPVHAQMLCEIATDTDLDLNQIDDFSLYDKFITLLFQRESQKKSRSTFDEHTRRDFSSRVAWWLMIQGGSSNVASGQLPEDLLFTSLNELPGSLTKEQASEELMRGCLVEKDSLEGKTLYFAHRSIQEFLCAEHIFNNILASASSLSPSELFKASAFSTPEICGFLYELFVRRPDGRERAALAIQQLSLMRAREALDMEKLLPFEVAYTVVSEKGVPADPWRLLLWYKIGLARGTEAKIFNNLLNIIRGNSTNKDLWLMAAQLSVDYCQRRQEIAYTKRLFLCIIDSIDTRELSEIMKGLPPITITSSLYRLYVSLQCISADQNLFRFTASRLFHYARSISDTRVSTEVDLTLKIEISRDELTDILVRRGWSPSQVQILGRILRDTTSSRSVRYLKVFEQPQKRLPHNPSTSRVRS